MYPMRMYVRAKTYVVVFGTMMGGGCTCIYLGVSKYVFYLLIDVILLLEVFYKIWILLF